MEAGSSGVGPLAALLGTAVGLAGGVGGGHSDGAGVVEAADLSGHAGVRGYPGPQDSIRALKGLENQRS